MNKAKIKGILWLTIYLAFFMLGYEAKTKGSLKFSLIIFGIGYFLILISKGRKKTRRKHVK